jgi:hypothetical protein
MVCRRFVSTFALAALAAGVLSGCCGKVCQKDPPCRPCENPCCLTPIQKVALAKSTHALPGGPEVYSYEKRTFVLFSEKGSEEFHKDPMKFKDAGALRLIRTEGTFLVDVDPGDDFDWASAKSAAVAYVPPPKPPKK